jgi:hypothetical protein
MYRAHIDSKEKEGETEWVSGLAGRALMQDDAAFLFTSSPKT